MLNGKIKSKIAKAFKDKLLKGTLTRLVAGASVDPLTGFPATSTPQTFDVEGFVDQYDEYLRARLGIPQEDCRIILINGNSEVEPILDDVVNFSTFGSFQLRSNIKTDPDKAHFDCQAFKI